MSNSTIHEFLACIDCTQFVAGISAHERGNDYPAATLEAMSAPEVARWTLVNACDDTCEVFTYRPCDMCATWIAGERHAVTALTR